MRLNDCLIKCFTKRMRYKVINDNYYHFVFQGYRVEMIIEKSYCALPGKMDTKKLQKTK